MKQKKEPYQVEFGKAGRDISHETFLALKEEETSGIIFIEDKKRFYPNGVFASYLIGFALKEEDDETEMSQQLVKWDLNLHIIKS